MKTITLLLATTALATILSSCQRTTTEATADTTQIAENRNNQFTDDQGRLTSFEGIMASIEELNSFPVAYDDSYFSNYESMTSQLNKAFKLPCDTLSQSMLPDTLMCDSKLHFIWKKSFDNYTLVDFATTSFGTKGESTFHHLVTVDDLGFIIDVLPEWAAMYSIAVENPNGGTSAGVEFKTGNIDGAIVTITSAREDGPIETAQLDDEGKFIKYKAGK